MDVKTEKKGEKSMRCKKEFEQFEIEKGRSIETIKNYISSLEYFFNWYAKREENLNNEDIENYKKHLLDARRLKVSTINKKLLCLKKYIEFVNNSDVGYTIYVNIILIRVQRQEYLQEMLSKNDFDRLVNAAQKKNDYRAVAIFKTLYYTGLRVSELLQVKVQDVKGATFEVKGKGTKYRTIFVHKDLYESLEPYLKARGDAESIYLFNGKKDKPISRQLVHKVIKKYAGLSRLKLSKCHAHNFRHLFCLELGEKGLVIEEIADLAGHNNINTTKIYMRKTKAQLLNAINKL